MTETDTFTVLKFGTFTAEDIKQRWITNDNSKFTSLPNEVKVRWLELLRDRYAEKVIPERKTEFINEANRYIELAESGDYSSVSYASSFYFFSFFDTFYSSFSSFCTLFSSSFSEELMNNLAIDASLLNDAIKEYSND